MTPKTRVGQLLVQEALYVRKSMLFHRRQFGSERRETTITDEVVADLRRRGRGLLHIAPAPGPESRHGADIELWLRGGGYFLGMLLQAKSLHPRKRSDGVYEYLQHAVGRGQTARNQVDILIGATRPPLVPMYLFYNGLEKKPNASSGCGSMNGFAKKNGRLGMTVTSARTVRRLLSSGRRRALSDVLPYSVPIQCLVECACPMAAIPQTALPLRVAEWPMAWVREAAPSLVPDPLRRPEESELESLRARGVRVYEGDLPSYVLELAQTGVVAEGFEVQGRHVVLADADNWTYMEDLIAAVFGDD